MSIDRQKVVILRWSSIYSSASQFPKFTFSRKIVGEEDPLAISRQIEILTLSFLPSRQDIIRFNSHEMPLLKSVTAGL